MQAYCTDNHNYVYRRQAAGTDSKPELLHHRASFIYRKIVLIFVIAGFITFGALMHAYALNNANASASTQSSSIEHEQTFVPVLIADKTSADSGEVVVYVQDGDTLWGIAEAYAPEHIDIRDYIYKLKKLNGLEGGLIHEGQKLILP